MMLERGLDHRRRLALGGLSVKLHNLLVFFCVGVIGVLIAGFSISVGSTDLDVWDALRILFGGSASEDEHYAIYHVRLPRIALAFMTGWAVALTGALLQSMAQNPLADPGLLGLSQGALTTIMILIVFFPMVPRELYPFAAMFGGLAVGLLLLILVGRENMGGPAILLMGIAVETTLGSVTSMLILYTAPEVSQALGVWLSGSLFYSNWDNVVQFSLWFGFAIAVILISGRPTKAFDLGDHMAMSLGEPASWSKPVILVMTVLITAACVTQVGPLAFLGILAPHLARFLSPATGKSRLFLASMMGGVLVVAADLVTRSTITSQFMPIGLTIIMVGAPLFIISLRLAALRHHR